MFSIPQLGFDWRRRLERVLDEYRTDYLLLETESGRGTLWREMAKHGAHPIYRDENTVLLGGR